MDGHEDDHIRPPEDPDPLHTLKVGAEAWDIIVPRLIVLVLAAVVVVLLLRREVWENPTALAGLGSILIALGAGGGAVLRRRR